MSAETDLWTATGKIVKLLHDVKGHAVGTFATDRETAIAGTVAGAALPMQSVIGALNAQLYSFANPGVGAPVLNAVLPEYARILAIAETAPADIFFRVFERFGSQPFTVKSRNRTFGSPSAGGSNIGTGAVVRLSTDRYAYKIESGSDEAKSWLCTNDANSGAKRHNERFLLRGAAITRTEFPMLTESSQIPGVKALSIDDSASYIQNPGFETWDATNGASGWSAGTAWSNFDTYTTSVYKDILPSTGTARALKFVASDYIYQTWSQQALNWNPYVPLYAQVAWMRLASATGTLKIKIGNVEATVDVSTGTNGVWNVLRWPLAAPASTAWFRSWNVGTDAATPPSNPFIKITMTSLAVGTVVIDDVICGPYTQFDGTWCAIVGGATPFLKEDVFTATDSSGATAIIQEYLARYHGVYLPSTTGGTESWADPA